MGSRAANNESSIHQDATGRWHGYVSMGVKEGGRRDRRHVTATTRRQVVAKVRALETKRDAGTALAAGAAPTVAVWMTEYLDNVAARRVRPSTLERYRSLARVQSSRGSGTTASTGSNPNTSNASTPTWPPPAWPQRPSCKLTDCCPGR
jgi:hypothetical protein